MGLIVHVLKLQVFTSDYLCVWKRKCKIFCSYFVEIICIWWAWLMMTWYMTQFNQVGSSLWHWKSNFFLFFLKHVFLITIFAWSQFIIAFKTQYFTLNSLHRYKYSNVSIFFDLVYSLIPTKQGLWTWYHGQITDFTTSFASSSVDKLFCIKNPMCNFSQIIKETISISSQFTYQFINRMCKCTKSFLIGSSFYNLHSGPKFIFFLSFRI